MDDLKRRRGLILQLARARHASNIRIFGSVARGDARRDSDVDFLVDLDPGATALDVTGLMTDLEDELGRRADVVVIRRQSPMGRRIRAEAVPL